MILHLPLNLGKELNINMKNIAIISFTRTGTDLNQNIKDILEKKGYACDSYASQRSAGEAEMITPLKDVKIWVEEEWNRRDGFVFVGATGIAVRMIAPHIKDKLKDPAVVVVDETGQFVISLLSGHIGGANELTEVLASTMNSTPVITTATDVQGKFAIDVWAKKNGLELGNRKAARMLSAAILEGQHVGFYCEYPVEGEIPPELTVCDNLKDLEWYTQRIAIRLSYSVGMGCKKNVPFENVESLFLEKLKELEIDVKQVEEIATIDIKKKEPALLALSKKYGIPLVWYSAEELAAAKMVTQSSKFVEGVTGVGNVCERAAFLASEEGEIVQPKEKGTGVTIAFAKKLRSIQFDERAEK